MVLSKFSELHKLLSELEQEVKTELQEKDEKIKDLENKLFSLSQEFIETEKIKAQQQGEISELHEEINSLKEKITQKDQAIETVQKDLMKAQTEQKAIQDRMKTLETENQSLASKLESVTFEKEKMASKLNEIKQRMQHLTQEYKTLSDKAVKDLDSLRLLDLYLALIEKVFVATPHIKVLLVLHGPKSYYTLQELAKATGIQPLSVRQVIFDLRKAQLIDYNEDTQQVRLREKILL